MDRSLFQFPWELYHTFPYRKSTIGTVWERRKHLRHKQEFKRSSTNLLKRNFHERVAIRETGRFNLDRIDERPKEWQRDLDRMQLCREKTRKVISDIRRKTRLSQACAVHGQAALEAVQGVPKVAAVDYQAEKTMDSEEAPKRKKKKDIRSPYSKHCTAAPKKLATDNALGSLKGRAEITLEKCTCAVDSVPHRAVKKEKKKITVGDLSFANGATIPAKMHGPCSPDPRARGRVLTPTPPQPRPRSCQLDILDGVPGLEGLSSETVRHLPPNYRPEAVLTTLPFLQSKRSVAELLKVKDLENEDFWRKAMPSQYSQVIANVRLNRNKLNKLQQQVLGDPAMSSAAMNDLAHQRRQAVCKMTQMGTVPVAGVLGRVTDYAEDYGCLDDVSEYDREKLAERQEMDRIGGLAIALEDLGRSWRRPRQERPTYTCNTPLLEERLWKKWKRSFESTDELARSPKIVNSHLIDEMLKIFPFPENAVCPRKGKEKLFKGAASRFVMTREMKLNVLDSLFDDPPDEPELVELLQSLEKFQPASFVVKLV